MCEGCLCENSFSGHLSIQITHSCSILDQFSGIAESRGNFYKKSFYKNGFSRDNFYNGGFPCKRLFLRENALRENNENDENNREEIWKKFW